MVREPQRLPPEAAVVLSPGYDHTESQWAGDWPPVTRAGRLCSLRRVNSLPFCPPGIYLAVQLNTGSRARHGLLQGWAFSTCLLSHPVAPSCPTLCSPVGCGPLAPLSMGLSWQEYWSGLPFPPPADLPSPETEPTSPAPPALQAGSLPTEQPGKPPFHLILTPKLALEMPGDLLQ